MEKSCRWCVYFNAKGRKCNRLESGFTYDREATVKTITDSVEDELDWVEYDGIKTVTEDDEFYCKYWR